MFLLILLLVEAQVRATRAQAALETLLTVT
jgi:hypothetical protein